MHNLPKNSVLFSALSFPPIVWWRYFIHSDQCLIDTGEYFEKRSYRNRYFIGTANGILGLSIPLKYGRNQKRLMKDIQISYDEDWQKKHWHAIISAYNRTPYFEFYKHHFEPLFHQAYSSLCEWNLEGIRICLKLLKVDKPIEISDQYIIAEAIEWDTRKWDLKTEFQGIDFSYIQPFEQKNGFLPNLSILDLLFCEGPQAIQLLKNTSI